MKRFTLIMTIIFTIVALKGCKKQNNYYDIPNVAIDQYIYLSNPLNFNLQVQGGWVYKTTGYKGLVIYRRNYNQDANDFIAYERACPIHYSESCGILKVENGSVLVCDCDQKEYILYDGSPMQDNPSPSVKFYRTIFDGINTIHVIN